MTFGKNWNNIKKGKIGKGQYWEYWLLGFSYFKSK